MSDGGTRVPVSSVPEVLLTATKLSQGSPSTFYDPHKPLEFSIRIRPIFEPDTSWPTHLSRQKTYFVCNNAAIVVYNNTIISQIFNE